MNPLVSVIIPSFNSAHFLFHSVNSALDQTYRPIEILVIDDGSADNTCEVLRQFCGCIRYYRQENKGLAGARNTGIKLATGTFLAFLDADDIWLPDKLVKQCRVLAENPEVGLVHSDIWYWRPETGEKLLKEKGREKYKKNCFDRLLSENRVTPSSVLVRKECFDKVGLFDERLRVYEDWDMWLRISRFFNFAYISEPLLNYRVHPGSLSANNLRMREGELAVLEKTLSNDPDLRMRFGKNEMDERVSKLSFDIGYQYFNCSEFRQAQPFFKKAFISNPKMMKVMIYYLVSLLPNRLICYCRKTKHKYINHYLDL